MVVWKGIVIVNPSCVNYLACPANAISNNRCRNFCIAIFFFYFTSSPTAVYFHMFAWATDAWGTHIAQWHSHTAPHTHTLEYIFIRILFSICFFFFSLFRFSLLSKSAIEICHAYRLSRTRWWGGVCLSTHSISRCLSDSPSFGSCHEYFTECGRGHTRHTLLFVKKKNYALSHSVEKRHRKKNENGEERCVCCMQHENGMRCADRQRYAMQRRGKRLMRKA